MDREIKKLNRRLAVDPNDLVAKEKLISIHNRACRYNYDYRVGKYIRVCRDRSLDPEIGRTTARWCNDPNCAHWLIEYICNTCGLIEIEELG